MKALKMSLTLECTRPETLAVITERVERYSSPNVGYKLKMEKLASNKISLAWELHQERIEQCELVNLDLSRHFYWIFSLFFRLGAPDEQISYELGIDHLFIAFSKFRIFSISSLNNLLASRHAAFAENGAHTGPNSVVYSELALSMVQKGLLRNEAVFIHYLLLACSAMIVPHKIRHEIVKQELIGTGARNLLDLGCGDGGFLMDAFESCRLHSICGIEGNYNKVKMAQKRARFRGLRKERAHIFKADIKRIDERFRIYDIVTLIEVLEHIPVSALPEFEQSLFDKVRPDYAIITTPNSDYNKHLTIQGKFRHNEHSFEWSYEEFSAWALSVCAAYNYSVEIIPVGGPFANDNSFLSQLALFRKINSSPLSNKQ
jgi:2-polyprenyl-3-methyl-5-hydroxy-6-metoxy-1,4-benzoquinol methylase